ncbi:MAG: regulatory iron-sulfur-containing complex subunit RicT [Brevinema sp.]
MLKVVKAKTVYDNNVRYYRIDQLTNIQAGTFYIGETYFGEDIVKISCHKVLEISLEQWNDMTKLSDKKGIKKSHFSFEPRLLRKALEQDISSSLQNIELAKTYRGIIEQKIKEHHVDMRVVDLHYTLAKDRLICMYRSPGRVDFRNLVRELGYLLKQRIDLFQISMQKHFLGEVGSCGNCLCCTTFISNYSDQKICYMDSIPKISKNIGQCGNLKCCLAFEDSRGEYGSAG